MGDVSLPILSNFIFFFSFPLIGGIIATKLRLPTLIGYILGGILLGLFLEKQTTSELLAEFANFGIILLLFTVGLEVDLADLKRFGRFVVQGGILQIMLSALLLFIWALLFQFNNFESIFIGFSFALSSTAVVAKIIQERGEENSLIGDLTLGILVLQDLAVIPLIIFFAAFGENQSSTSLISNLLFGLARSGSVLALIYLMGKTFLPLIFDSIAIISRELLNLTTIFLILFLVYVFASFGLSASMAAFIAGVLVGQTAEHYHIFSQIRPLRDIFAILFFVFLGASVNISLIVTNIHLILAFTAILMLLKIIVVLGLLLSFRFHTRTSFSIALYLSQVGEFSFVLLYQGLSRNLISQETYLFAITCVLLTIIATPLLIKNKDYLYYLLKVFIQQNLPRVNNYLKSFVDEESPHIDAFKLKGHVVICGYGRVGQYIGKALKMAQIPFVGVDYNYYVVQKAKASGIKIIYGDPTDIDILDYAQIEYARTLVVAVPEKFSQKTIILNAKKLNSSLQIYSRIHNEADQQQLHDLGAEVVVQPEFEASLTIIRYLLNQFHIPRQKIVTEFRRLKLDHDYS